MQSIIEKEQEITLLKEMVIQFQNRKFGVSSDRIDIAKQPDLFNEAEAVVEQTDEVDEPTEVVVTRRKRETSPDNIMPLASAVHNDR